MGYASQPLFELQSVSFQYDSAAVLRDLTLRIMPGQRIALLGANGSGKSTLLRLLDGLLFPPQGSVEYCGVALSEKTLAEESFAFRFRHEVALLFQDPDVQLFCPSVWDEVAFGPSQFSISDAELNARVIRSLEDFDIADLANRSPHYLSGGEKRRVGLASLFVLNPAVLLLDEPSASLDPKARCRLIDLLLDHADSGHTLVTATHDLQLVDEIADVCLVMDKGQIIAAGSPVDILSDTPLLEHANLILRARPPRVMHAVRPGSLTSIS
jgi:cobalt/nickel transport system ATP-binding protein